MFPFEAPAMTQQLSPRQFADAIGVSESSVRRWADAGEIAVSICAELIQVKRAE